MGFGVKMTVLWAWSRLTSWYSLAGPLEQFGQIQHTLWRNLGPGF